MSDSCATTQYFRERVAKIQPKSKLLSLAGPYITKRRTYIRDGTGLAASHMVAIPKGATVISGEGRYTSHIGSKWMYVELIHKRIRYVGFCPINHLKKVESKK